MTLNPAKTAMLLATFTLVGVGTAHAGQPLKICDDDSGWPPYTYVDPKNPKVVTGASADVIVEILKRAGYEPEVTLLPWKRCLLEVEEGRTAMLLNASFSEERAQKYLMSKPYYAINSALFYNTSKYPTPPKIASVAEMKPYRYCGLYGYNYTMYNLPPAQLDAGAKDEVSRFQKLRLDRCDFVLGDIEILNSFASMGQLDLTGIGHIPIPGDKPKEFHAMVSRTAAGGEKLLKIIDDGIGALKADKTYSKIFKKYGI